MGSLGEQSRAVRLGAFAAAVLVFAGFGVVLRVWFLARGGLNQPIPLSPVFAWCLVLGFFRDALLGGVLASPLLVASVPREHGWWWRPALVVVAAAMTATVVLLAADVEFMRFYEVHMSAYVLSYLDELGPLSGSINALLAPWEWVVAFGLIPIAFVVALVRAWRENRSWWPDPRTRRGAIGVATILIVVIAGVFNYKMTRWFTREPLAYQLSDNGVLYFAETMRNRKYAAPPVPDEARFAVARDQVRAAVADLPLDADSDQRWYFLDDEFAWVRGTAHHACGLGRADDLGIDCDADADGDGHPVRDDCDDTRADVYPGAPDPPLDRIDQDCDGIDDGRPNVVLVLLEQSRGVNVGAFRDVGGFPEGVTPALDALAGEGLLYSNVYANGVTTARAVVATLAGVHPHVGPMLLRDYAYLQLPSIGTVLGQHGYRRAYMHSGDTRFDNKRRWLKQWFDDIHDMTNVFADAPRVTSWGVDDAVLFDHALKWADERAGQPFFMTVFTVTNHHPFTVPKRAGFTPPIAHPSTTYEKFLNTMAYQDFTLGQFLTAARTRPWFANTYIVIVADTGQVMGERRVHNDMGALPPYEAAMWVPLAIVGPGIAPDATLSTQVGSQVDFAPTLLDLLGIQQPHAFAGRSLLATVPHERGLAVVSNPYREVWVALRRGDHKLIHARLTGTDQCYDLATDRDEQRDLAASGECDPSADVALLDAWVDLQEYLVFHNRLWDPAAFAWPPATD